MPLDPVFEEMLKQMAEAGAPALIDLPPAEGRALYRAMNETMPQVELLSVTDKSIPVHEGEIGIRIYRQSDDSAQPCLVFYHGGGWVIGDLETHDSVCRQLCREAACTVIAVDYRLAPEFPFPTPVNDCYSALKWVHDQA
ncbi:MAG: alpha/beta hydrolase fold domain-containing protein, partial [Gammaproteobacteria bacterium]|nr:alpha/beta hydrolase fold domain-containing protein [Gammaproteobacteria bacterium]